MKLISGLLIHDTPDGTIAVATGKASTVLNGMIRLSPVAAFLFREHSHKLWMLLCCRSPPRRHG